MRQLLGFDTDAVVLVACIACYAVAVCFGH